MISLLYLETDPAEAQLVVQQLQPMRYQITHVREGLEALVKGLTLSFDTAVLNLDTIDLDGIRLIRYLREHKQDLVIFATSSFANIEEQQAALQVGANDYLSKPFHPEELHLRLQNWLSLQKARPKIPTPVFPPSPPEASFQSKHLIQQGEVVLDLRKCSVRRGGVEFDLPPRELDLLEFMMRRPNSLISREELLEHVWGYEPDTRTRVVENYVSRLRKKIDQNFSRKCIHTEREHGYSFRVP